MLFRSIQAKILFWAGLCICATAGMVLYQAAREMRSGGLANARREVEGEARAQLESVEAELAQALSTARGLAQTLSAVKDEQVKLDLSRENVTGILAIVLAQNPKVTSVFTAWEPKDFDGMDAAFQNVGGYDATGRFAPLCSRDAQGKAQFAPLADCEDASRHAAGGRKGDWYLLARESRGELVLPPRSVTLPDGQQRLVARVVVPIVTAGNFHGVAGVDCDLSFAGTLAASLAQKHPTWSLEISAGAGSSLASVAGSARDAAAPLIATELATGLAALAHPWKVSLSIPEAEATASAHAVMLAQVELGVCLILGGLLLLWLIAGTISRPVRQAAEVLQCVARGDFTRKVRSRSRDEAGRMAEAVNRTTEVLETLKQEVGALAQNAREGRLSERADVARFEGSYRELVQGLNGMLDATLEPIRESTAVLERLAAGDLTAEVRGEYQGDHRIIQQNLNQTSRVLREVLGALGRLISSAQEGDLTARADLRNLRGSYMEMCMGINAMLDATVTPIRECSAVLQRVSRGDLSVELATDYKGDHRVVQESLTQTVTVLRVLLEETRRLIEAGRRGDLSVRADSARFEGAFRELCEGINSMLDANLKPIQESAEVLRRVADGDLSQEVRGEYAGEFGRIRDNLNGTVRVLSDLLGETQRLTERARAGELDVRADDSRFQGSYKELCGGINSMLDATLEPIRESAAVLERVAAGDLGTRVAGNYAGDHRLMQEHVNQTIDVLRELLRSMRELIEKAQGGQLMSRADGSHYRGAYADLCTSVNELLDAIVEPIQEASRSLASSSAQMQKNSTRMRGDAGETSNEAGLVASTAGELNSSVDAVATAATQMSASISEISRSTSRAASVASAAVTKAQATNQSVARLGAASEEIGAVIKLIGGIAAQTNLLALNATIEAARAGEAGKGFAVVAHEVKQLASQCASAASEIGQKIAAIQGGTREAVQAIGEIRAIIDDINQIQASIAAAVEQQTATTSEISRSAHQAAAGSSSIATAIAKVAAAAQSTTQGAEEAQKAAEGLSRMSRNLEVLVGTGG